MQTLTLNRSSVNGLRCRGGCTFDRASNSAALRRWIDSAGSIDRLDANEIGSLQSQSGGGPSRRLCRAYELGRVPDDHAVFRARSSEGRALSRRCRYSLRTLACSRCRSPPSIRTWTGRSSRTAFHETLSQPHHPNCSPTLPGRGGSRITMGSLNSMTASQLRHRNCIDRQYLRPDHFSTS